MRTVFVLETRVDFYSNKEWVPFRVFIHYSEASVLHSSRPISRSCLYSSLGDLNVKPIRPSNAVVGKHVVFAENQPEYLPLPAVLSEVNPNVVVTEWEFDEADIDILKNGGHLFFQQMNFGQSLQPINLQVRFEEIGPTIING